MGDFTACFPAEKAGAGIRDDAHEPLGPDRLPDQLPACRNGDPLGARHQPAVIPASADRITENIVTLRTRSTARTNEFLRFTGCYLSQPNPHLDTEQSSTHSPKKCWEWVAESLGQTMPTRKTSQDNRGLQRRIGPQDLEDDFEKPPEAHDSLAHRVFRLPNRRLAPVLCPTRSPPCFSLVTHSGRGVCTHPTAARISPDLL
ncbi:hypothetical protein FB478_103476 [Arthrobacter sp. AG367]|nr:hypothetical protein FB478_103476 [Arthrobacter sp. AG367]